MVNWSKTLFLPPNNHINIMASRKKSVTRNPWGQVKHDPVVLEMVRKNKEKTGQEIGKFYDIAAVEKLERDKE